MRKILIVVFTAFFIAPALNANPNEEGPTPEDVAFVQGLLKRFGYDPGPIDGICGDLTAHAVRSFHQDRNLPLKPGDVEPQAATVAGNLIMALTDGVMQPKQSTPKIYQEALAGDAAAALTVGMMYYRGDSVPTDNMLAYAWWAVAETNGNPQAAKMKQGLAAAGQVSEHEIRFAESLAEKICESSPHTGDIPSSVDAKQPPSATM